MTLDRFLLDSIFDRADFNADQIKEMELGLQESGTIDYANPKFTAEEMRKMRKPLQIKIKRSTET